MASGSLCLVGARGDTAVIKCYICQLFRRHNEEEGREAGGGGSGGGEGWVEVRDAGRNGGETSVGDTMRTGVGLLEEKIEEASRGKRGRRRRWFKGNRRRGGIGARRGR